jgi:hypothetical protein
VHLRLRRFIAAFEFVGGFVGMALASNSAAAPGLSIFHRVLVGLLGLPFALSVYAGRALWLGESRGYLLSMLVQAAQVFAWSSPYVLYMFFCGAQLGAWFGTGGVTLLWGLGSRFTLNVVAYPRAEGIGVNLLALWALGHLTVGWLGTRRGWSLAGRPFTWCRLKQSSRVSS